MGNHSPSKEDLEGAEPLLRLSHSAPRQQQQQQQGEDSSTAARSTYNERNNATGSPINTEANPPMRQPSAEMQNQTSEHSTEESGEPSVTGQVCT